MQKTIPVVRAASLTPMIKWLAAQGRPVDDMLRRCGLGYVWLEDPYLAIPVRAVESFVIEASRLEGPDFGCKVLTAESLHDIAAVGQIALSSRTPREGLTRVCHAMPYHSSHQILSMTTRGGETVIQEYWQLPLAPEAQHIMQQYVAGLIGLLIQAARPAEPAFAQVEMVPHPHYGLDHLQRCFRAPLAAAGRPLMALTVPQARLDAPLREARRIGAPAPSSDAFPWQRLRDGTIAGSARHVVRSMLREGSPTIDRFAALADMSIRTLQRRLATEGVSFSALIEDVRREVALQALCSTQASVGDVSANLGYSKQSSLTRAVRRWTGVPPMALRQDGMPSAEG